MGMARLLRLGACTGIYPSVNDAVPSESLPPFPPGYRAAGALLHVTSLASPYGIGDLGPRACRWIDRLADANLSWWQVLPLGPTGFANSPYQPNSSFAGNATVISPDWLIEDGLLLGDECTAMRAAASHQADGVEQRTNRTGPNRAWSDSHIDFARLVPPKLSALRIACDRFLAQPHSALREPFDAFCHDNSDWLDDFALYHSLKTRYDESCFWEWPSNLIHREPGAIAVASEELEQEINRCRFAQFVFHRQMRRLRSYAAERGVRLIGDLPFFVSPDSSDVWAHPNLFLLNAELRPTYVAGVPPDYFSEDGQLWGNPVYDWDQHRNTNFQWWIARFRSMLQCFDAVRLDHFRAFVAAWHIPAKEKTARGGDWVPGPSDALFDASLATLGHLPFLAEDLGTITHDVNILRDKYRFPGARVLQFAFDGERDNPYLPVNYEPNTVAYTGTHDNPPSQAWLDQLPLEVCQSVANTLQAGGPEPTVSAWDLVRAVWNSNAALAIAPVQDFMQLGEDSRMNVPGTTEGNWDWRWTENGSETIDFEAIRQLTQDAGRAIP